MTGPAYHQSMWPSYWQGQPVIRVCDRLIDRVSLSSEYVTVLLTGSPCHQCMWPSYWQGQHIIRVCDRHRPLVSANPYQGCPTSRSVVNSKVKSTLAMLMHMIQTVLQQPMVDGLHSPRELHSAIKKHPVILSPFISHLYHIYIHLYVTVLLTGSPCHQCMWPSYWQGQHIIRVCDRHRPLVSANPYQGCPTSRSVVNSKVKSTLAMLMHMIQTVLQQPMVDGLHSPRELHSAIKKHPVILSPFISHLYHIYIHLYVTVLLTGSPCHQCMLLSCDHVSSVCDCVIDSIILSSVYVTVLLTGSPCHQCAWPFYWQGQSVSNVCYYFINMITLSAVYVTILMTESPWQGHPVISVCHCVIDRVTPSSVCLTVLLTGSPCHLCVWPYYWQGHTVSSVYDRLIDRVTLSAVYATVVLTGSPCHQCVSPSYWQVRPVISVFHRLIDMVTLSAVYSKFILSVVDVTTLFIFVNSRRYLTQSSRGYNFKYIG